MDYKLKHTYKSGCPQAIGTVTSGNQVQDFVVDLTGCEATIQANPTSVNSAAGAAGRTITVTGNGFTADAQGKLALSTQASPPVEVVAVQFTANAQGGLPQGTTIVVPANQAAGTYTLATSGAAGVSVKVDITVTNSRALSGTIAADRAQVDITGDETARTVNVTGTGFASGVTGRIKINNPAGQEVAGARVTTDQEGDIKSTALVIPETSGTGKYQAAAAFTGLTVEPVDIAVTSSQAPILITETDAIMAGEQLALGGSGYNAAAKATITLAQGETAVVSKQVNTDAAGVFANILFQVPADTATGEYVLRATTGDRVSPDSPIHVEDRHSIILPSRTDLNSAQFDDDQRSITVTGAQFPASTTGKVTLLTGEPGSTDGTVVSEAETTTEDDGTFTDAVLVVPRNTDRGEHHITAVIGAETSDDTPVLIRYPQGTWKPESPRNGDKIKFSGRDFHPWPNIDLKLSYENNGAYTGINSYTSKDGTVQTRTLEANRGAGTYYIQYWDHSKGSRVISKYPVLVSAILKVTPDVTTIPAGQTLHVTGQGFAASSSGRVGLYDAGTGTEIIGGPITTDDKGAFPMTGLVVPDDGTAIGVVKLRAKVGSDTSPDVDITVTAPNNQPVVTVSPDPLDSTGPDDVDRTITVSGTGFPASKQGQFEFHTSMGDEIEGKTTTTDANGAFTSTLVIPDNTATGKYTIKAVISGAETSKTFNIKKGAASVPSLSPNKTTVSKTGDDASRTITVSGTDFTNGSGGLLAVIDRNTPHMVIADVNVSADANGAFTGASLTVPAATDAGTYDLTTIGVIGIAAFIPITVTA